MSTGSRLRRLWVAVALLAFGFVLASRFSELEMALHRLRHADPALLALGVAPLCLVLLSQAGVLRESLGAVGVSVRLWSAVRTSLAMEFMQMALPSAGASGAGYLAAHSAGGTRGAELQESVGASVVYYLSGYLALLIVVVVASAMGLTGVGGLNSVLLVVGVGLLGAGTLYAGPAAIARFHRPLAKVCCQAVTLLSRAMGELGLVRATERLRSVPPRVQRFWDEAARVADVASTNRRRSLAGLVCALGVDVGSLALLWLVSRSVGADLTLKPLFVSYSIGTALAIFSVTPSGVGIMEPAMLVSMTKYGIHIGTAAAAIALYRLVGFWFPFVLGLVSILAERRKSL